MFLDHKSTHPIILFSGLLTQCESYKIYGYLSATKTKILLMIANNVDVMFR